MGRSWGTGGVGEWSEGKVRHVHESVDRPTHSEWGFVTGSSRNEEQKNRMSLMMEALKNLAK